MKKLVAALTAVTMLAGCSVIDLIDAKEEVLFNLDGSIVDYSFIPSVTSICVGVNVAEGDQVIITDDSGRTLATTDLEAGVPRKASRTAADALYCVFNFKFHGLPMLDFYHLRVEDYSYVVERDTEWMNIDWEIV